MKAYKGSTDTDPLILNVNTWWELSSQLQAFNFKPLPLYLQEGSTPPVAIKWAQIQSRDFGEQKNLLSLAGI